MKNYDPKKESKFIMYLDENNSYGWGMSQVFLMVDLSGSKMLIILM